MVKHREALESKLVAQWREEYIDYPYVISALEAAAKEVHSLLGARLSADVGKTPQLSRGSGRAQIVVDELADHRAFTHRFSSELSKAKAFFFLTLTDIKAEFLHILIASMELGLLDTFVLTDHDPRRAVDPGAWPAADSLKVVN